ncbi:hypothetical protein [Nonomuraea fuscirosea]|uniref:hypothetical protein n=1 Tax=Nonomuraea fuscirosea TaxID=1291556 RepID=UPI0033C46B6E
MATEPQAPAHEKGAQTYAPTQVANAVTELLGAYSPTLDAYIWGSAEEATITVNVTPIDDVGNEEAQDTCAFQALVVEVDHPALIVLGRPDVVDTRNLEGGSYEDSERVGWEVAPADERGRATRRADAAGVTFQGSGHISWAEARRMGAALIALAEASQASQAGQDGAQHG